MQMEYTGVVSSDILKELPHLLESWWNVTLCVTSQINSGLIKVLPFSSRGWLDISFEYLRKLGHDLNFFSVWWALSMVFTFAVFVRLWLGHYPTTQKRLKTLTSNIPGPLSLPVLGNVPTFAGCNLVQFFQKLVDVVNKYGPIVRFWMGNELYIVISDAESIENLLTSKAVITKNAPVSKILNGSGITLGNNWKLHRRIISSTFNTNVLDQFMGSFAQNSSALIQKLKSHADGSSFNIYPFICACTLDVICETVMGTNINKHMEGDDVFMKNLLRVLEEELDGTFKKPWMLNEWMQNGRRQRQEDKEKFVKYLRDFVDKVVTEKLENRRNGLQQNRGNLQVEYLQWVRGREMCLLDLLLLDDHLSVEEIKEELCTLIVAGTKVTAVACCFVLSLLGVYQEVQHTVLQEQEKIFGSDTHTAATSKDLSDMTYLEQVMKETLRLYPPVPFLFRKLEEDTRLENGYILPKDSCVVVFSYMTHRNADCYPDPELFNPERFLRENHPYAYIPFGGGRRICVAYKYGMMEAKMILSAVVRAYHVTTPGGAKSLDSNLQAGVLLTLAKGFDVQILPRSAKALSSVLRDG